MDAGIVRICGCTSKLQPMPVLTDLMDQTILGCRHGFEPEWKWLRSITGKPVMPFGQCMSSVVKGTIEGMSELGDPHGMPHVDLFLFTHSIVKEIVGVQVTAPYTYDIVWDPCPVRERVFHNRKSAIEWIAGQIVANRDNGDPGFTVISLG